MRLITWWRTQWGRSRSSGWVVRWTRSGVLVASLSGKCDFQMAFNVAVNFACRSWSSDERTGWPHWSWAAPFYLRPIATNSCSTSWASPCCDRDASRSGSDPQAPSSKGLLMVTSKTIPGATLWKALPGSAFTQLLAGSRKPIFPSVAPVRELGNCPADWKRCIVSLKKHL